jgi:uncharacterized protein YjiS (DUF1127 family)
MSRLGGRISSVFLTLELAMQVHRERRSLTLLDSSALKDMGLDQAEVNVESGRGFWDVPADRIRW